MIQRDSAQSEAIILYCTKMIDKINHSGRAKATMVYLLKEFSERFKTLSKETLRRLIKQFNNSETEMVILQILNLSAKLLANQNEDEKLYEICNFLFNKALNDESLLVRQKAKMIRFIFDK